MFFDRCFIIRNAAIKCNLKLSKIQEPVLVDICNKDIFLQLMQIFKNHTPVFAKNPRNDFA
jgi:hypothetical protein